MRTKVPEWLSTTLSVVLLGLLFVAYFVFYRPHAPVPIQPVARPAGATLRTPAFTHPLAIGSTHLSVAFAITGTEQEQGLSDTAALASDTGMLFLFTSDSIVPFWMKDMRYPLDIIWIGSDKTVKDITPDLAVSTYPNSFSPKVPVRYVLEVPAGFAAANGIGIGSAVSF